jgi:hypothetical protein
MVREPNLKNAVEIIREEFAAAGIKLPYQKTLDVVAKSKGYAGYEHYLKAQADGSKNCEATADAADPRPFKTELVFGSERVAALEHGTHAQRIAALGESECFSFATEAELDAFSQGVEAAEGWLDYQVVDEADRARLLAPDEEEAQEPAEMNVHYRTMRIRAYLPISEFSVESVSPNTEGRLPVELEHFNLNAVYQADNAHLEAIPYRAPLRFVLTNDAREVHVLEFDAQLMFEAVDDDAVRQGLENLDYTVTLGSEKRIVETEIASW